MLSERYITDRFLPDKAIDLIDEACSDVNLQDKNINRRMELERDLENATSSARRSCRRAREGKELTEEQLDATLCRARQAELQAARRCSFER